MTQRAVGFKAKISVPIELEALMNLSDKTAGWLRDMGIVTCADLMEQDLDMVYLALRSAHPQVTRLMYYALWGAVRGVHWNCCPVTERTRVANLIKPDTVEQ